MKMAAAPMKSGSGTLSSNINRRKLLFTFKGGKQVAALPPPDSTADLPAIKTLVETAFDALTDKDSSNNITQGFDEDFEEWLDFVLSIPVVGLFH